MIHETLPKNRPTKNKILNFFEVTVPNSNKNIRI